MAHPAGLSLRNRPWTSGRLEDHEPKTRDRQLSTWNRRGYMGSFSGETATPGDVVEFGCLESSIQVVHPCSRTSPWSICGCPMRGPDLFPDEVYSPPRIHLANEFADAAFWSFMGRNSLEGLCLEEAPNSLLSIGVRVDPRRVLGGVAHPFVGGDAGLSYVPLIAGHLS